MQHISCQQVLAIKRVYGWPIIGAKRPKKSARGNSYYVLLGLGSNIEPEILRFKKLLIRIKGDARIKIIATSPLVINEPFGYLNQKNFTNATALIKTSLAPNALLAWALNVERSFNRVRSFKNAPRTLDIDILYLNAPSLPRNERLIIPHPGAHERASVYVPLGLMKLK